MAYTIDAIIKSQAEQYRAERASAFADLEAARLNEDAVGTMDAANRIVEIDGKIEKVGRYAQEMGMITPQQQALNADEIEVAKISGISPEEYARNKARMNAMKDQGYWSQGKVFK